MWSIIFGKHGMSGLDPDMGKRCFTCTKSATKSAKTNSDAKGISENNSEDFGRPFYYSRYSSMKTTGKWKLPITKPSLKKAFTINTTQYDTDKKPPS